MLSTRQCVEHHLLHVENARQTERLKAESD